MSQFLQRPSYFLGIKFALQRSFENQIDSCKSSVTGRVEIAIIERRLVPENTFFDKRFAMSDSMRLIDAEDVNCHISKRPEPDKPSPIPPKMVTPNLTPWVKQLRYHPGLGIDPGQFRALMVIAGKTGERKIVE